MLTTIENANTVIQIKPNDINHTWQIQCKRINKQTNEFCGGKAAHERTNERTNGWKRGRHCKQLPAIATVHKPINIFGMIYNKTEIRNQTNLLVDVVVVVVTATCVHVCVIANKE